MTTKKGKKGQKGQTNIIKKVSKEVMVDKNP
jgi:hypothetical protein